MKLLRRCPFCKGKAHLDPGHDHKGRGGWTVRCSNTSCEAEIWAYEKKTVIENWNRRVKTNAAHHVSK